MNTQSVTNTLSDFIDILSDKQKEVIKKRYGLPGDKPMTLEAIGKQYGVTRERIRQIEAGALDTLRKNINDLGDIVEKLKYQIDILGGIRREERLLEETTHSFSDSPLFSVNKEKDSLKNHISFLLDLAPYFGHLYEKPVTHSAWYSDKDSLKKVDSIHKFSKKELNKAKKPLQLDEYHDFIRKVMKEFKIKNESTAISYLDLSKEFAFNPFYEFGLSKWPLIKPTSVSTKAYLVMKKNGEPMHFSKIADAINEVDFDDDKKAQTSTVHNELIKNDDTFVLMGRGLYALADWGYRHGTVKDLLIEALEKKAKTYRELVEELKGQRQVKDATVLINLQDKNIFKRVDQGKYALKK